MMIHDFVCKTEHIVRDLRHGGKKVSNSVRQVDSRTKCNQQKLAYSLKKIDNRGMYRSNTQIQTLKYIQPYHIQKKSTVYTRKYV